MGWKAWCKLWSLAHHQIEGPRNTMCGTAVMLSINGITLLDKRVVFPSSKPRSATLLNYKFSSADVCSLNMHALSKFPIFLSIFWEENVTPDSSSHLRYWTGYPSHSFLFYYSRLRSQKSSYKRVQNVLIPQEFGNRGSNVNKKRSAGSRTSSWTLYVLMRVCE